jgi:hypothetical protein
MLSIHHHDSARTFLARAKNWLLDHEIECATALQSARNASGNDALYERPTYWATVEDEDSIVGCCYRTPPYHVGVTALPEDALTTLIADLAATYDNVSGFSGPEQTATVMAQVWTALRGGSWRVTGRQRLLALPAELPPRATPGVLRLAGKNDAGLAQSWGAAAGRRSTATSARSSRRRNGCISGSTTSRAACSAFCASRRASPPSASCTHPPHTAARAMRRRR